MPTEVEVMVGEIVIFITRRRLPSLSDDNKERNFSVLSFHENKGMTENEIGERLCVNVRVRE